MAAFIAVSNDATAPAWNPAGLAELSRGEVSVVYDRFTIDIDAPSFGVSGPAIAQTIAGTGSGDYSHIGFAAVALTSRVGNAAIMYRKLSTFPELETVLTGDRSLGGAPAQQYSSLVALIPGGDIYNYAFTFSKDFGRVNIGASVNQIEADPTSTLTLTENGTLFTETAARAFSRTYFDIGVLLNLSSHWSAGAVYHSDDETLPSQFAAGLAYQPSSRLTVAADYSETRTAVGGEFVMAVADELRLPIRAGYFVEQRTSLYGQRDTDYDGWSIGGGMDFDRVRIDVAYVRAEATERANSEVGELFVPPLREFVTINLPARSAKVATERLLLSLTVRL